MGRGVELELNVVVVRRPRGRRGSNYAAPLSRSQANACCARTNTSSIVPIGSIRRISDGNPRAVLARLKQLVRFWEAAELFAEDRREWLKEMDAWHLLDRLERRRAAAPVA